MNKHNSQEKFSLPRPFERLTPPKSPASTELSQPTATVAPLVHPSVDVPQPPAIEASVEVQSSAEISIHLRTEVGKVASAYLKIVERETDGTTIRSRKSLKIADAAAAISLFAIPAQLGHAGQKLIAEAGKAT